VAVTKASVRKRFTSCLKVLFSVSKYQYNLGSPASMVRY